MMEPHTAGACPQCGDARSAEIVYVSPVDERKEQEDRRRGMVAARRFVGADKRSAADRRKSKAASENDSPETRPDTTCLACGHEWKAH